MREVKTSGWDLKEVQMAANASINNVKNGFVGTGYYLGIIRSEKLWREDGSASFDEYMSRNYQKDKSWASKCISVYDQFGEQINPGDKPRLRAEYQEYNVSQLFELIYLPEEKREEVTPKTPVKAIRELKPKKEKKVSTVETPETENLSAYGTLIKVYPEDSLLTTPGCEGGHDCFSCHLQCDIRQEYCRCVEAPTGNPFPCEQISRVDSLREEIGGRCQFIDLDQAYHRAGDHEPVPCCKRCKEPCQYACERSIRKREAEEHTCNMEPDACPHREGYSCTLTPDQKNTPGDGNQCERSCCWECKYRGMCEPECDSSAGRDGERPEFDAAWFVRKWVERFPNDLKVVMRICREHLSDADRAKAVQKYISPYGARCQCCWEYDFSFHGFAGGMDFRIGQVQIHLKYGRFVTELLALYDPSSPEYDEEPEPEPVPSEPEPVIDAEFEEIPEPAAELKQIGELNLSCRSENILKRAGIDTVEKLISMSDEELAAIRGMSNRALEEIKTKLNELESADKAEPEESTTDLQVVRQMLEKENKLLNTCLLTVPDQDDIHIRQMKLRVAALAAFASDLDDIENPPPKPVCIYTLEEVAKEITRLEAAFFGAPVEVKQSAPYCKNVMRLDAMRLLYDSMKG
ncbi:MAG: DNA-directed RNA polymerase subunit alpha C-terminal domain-containing protein [Hungatella sp.]